MTFTRSILVLAAVVSLTTGASGADLPAVASLVEGSRDAASVLDHKYIFVNSGAALEIDFDRASRAFDSPDLLTEGLAAYVPPQTTEDLPPFQIEQVASNRWYYINRRGHRSDVTELHRHASTDDRVDLVYFASGKRSFGDFRSLVHLRISRLPDGNVGYETDVYAYPANGLIRFFVRRLHLVERFFDEKTDKISEAITQIAYRMNEEPPAETAGTPAAEALEAS